MIEKLLDEPYWNELEQIIRDFAVEHELKEAYFVSDEKDNIVFLVKVLIEHELMKITHITHPMLKKNRLAWNFYNTHPVLIEDLIKDIPIIFETSKIKDLLVTKVVQSHLKKTHGKYPPLSHTSKEEFLALRKLYEAENDLNVLYKKLLLFQIDIKKADLGLVK